MKRVVFAGVAMAALVGAGEALAQARFNEPGGAAIPRAHVVQDAFPGLSRPQASAAYGGGFIEMLMTGRDPAAKPSPTS